MAITLTTSWKVVRDTTLYRDNVHLICYAKIASQSTENNCSYVDTWLGIKIDGDWSYTTDSVKAHVSGASDISWGRTTFSSGETKLASGQFRVDHESDGSARTWVTMWITQTYGGSTDSIDTEWLYLPSIPRASSPTLNNTNLIAGQSVTISMNRKSTAFTHKVSYSFGKKSGVIATGVVDNCTWTPSTSLLDQIPDATTGAGTITVETYNGNTKTGDGSCVFALHVPSDASPSINEFDITENNANVKSKGNDITIQQISNKTVKVTVTPKYYASISSVTLNGANMMLNNGEYTATVGNLNDGKFTVKVKDSRGLTTSKAVEQKFYSYSRPQITGASLKRASETEANGELKIDGKYSTTLNNTLKVEIMRNDVSYYTVLEATLSDGTVYASKTYDDLYYTATWSVDIRLTDGFGETATTTVRLGVGQYAVAIGKYDVKVGRNAYVNNEVRAKNFKFAGASPCMHYVGNAWHMASQGVAVQMTSALSGHRFTDVVIYDPDYIEKVYDDGGYPSVRIKKKGRYLLPAKVRGSNVQGNSSYGFGFTVNKIDNSGEWADNQYEIRFTSYSCAGTAMFIKDLNEGDIIRYQVFSDLTRTCEYLYIDFIYLTDQ
nr:MAG TPA: protein of unknown function DUF859 [Caudoviricetes sp.]